MTGPTTLMEALALHQAGHLNEAGGVYRAILDEDPANPDALHLLGLVERRTGAIDRGLSLIRRALTLSPTFSPALSNFITMLFDAGENDEAERWMHRAIGLEPANTSIPLDFARRLYGMERFDGAIAMLRRGVANTPNDVDLVGALMGVLQLRGRHREAEAAYAEHYRRQPANITSLRHIDVQRWCRPVDDARTMLDTPETVWVTRAGGGLPVAPPDFHLDDDDLTAPGFINDQIIDMRGHVQDAGDSFIAHLRNVTIERVSRLHALRPTFHVLVEPGLALADAYHNRVMTDRLLSFTGERAWCRVAGHDVALDLHDAAPPDQTITEPGILLAGRYTQSNYFHWIFEGVARLWCLEALPNGHELPLFMHGEGNKAFHRQILDALKLPNPVIPLTGRTVRLDRLYFPSFLAPGTYGAPPIEWLRRRLLPAFGIPMWPKGGRRLYLSRSDVAVRSLIDEEWLIASLRSHGFEVVVPGRMSVAEQIRTFAEAEIVVGPHGAGNINMIFAPPGATLLELVPASTRAVLYWMTAKAAGQRYGRLICAEEASSGRLRIDRERFAALLAQALA